VLVAAPTGAGKTVVGEMAVAAALRRGGRAFYTAPIKALSNQKFHDLRAELGDARVGLLTGDHSINGDAPVVVMTTEVLRNMIYAGSSALDRLQWVVLDEVHFLQDTYRGPVWEEVLIHAPAHVRFVCLSATVSNAAELGEWIEALRGPTTTVVEHHRPVELDPLFLVGDRHSEHDHLLPLLVDGRPNPEGQRFDSDEVRGPSRGPGRGRPRRRFHTPRRVEVVERLRDEGLLPAIVFIFSRNGCDDAAAMCMDSGLRLTEVAEAQRIRGIAERHAAALEDADLDVLGYDRWVETLAMGIAAHHAGMIPAFREAVEECFVNGLVKVVFATETLALGINMPARSVVIERLTKFTGDGHEILTPSQFTQLTGRAGRRGIDDRGAAIVLWTPFTPFARIAELAASREFSLQSVFRPSYNMAANLVDRYDRDEAHRVLARSFAQFQADRSVSRLRQRRDDRAAALDEARRATDAGPGVRGEEVLDYLELVRRERDLRRHRPGGRAAVERSLAALRPGDVVQLATAKGPRLLAVVSVAQRKGAVKVEAISARGTPVRFDADSAGGPVEAVGAIELPVPFVPKDPSFRREAGARLRRVNQRRLRSTGQQAAGAEEAAWQDARRAVRSHPVHGLAGRDELVRDAERARRLDKEVTGLDRQIAQRGTDLVQRFDTVLGVLEDHAHLDGWALTPAGRRLRRIYHESDLLVSLMLAEGLLDHLDPPSVAALVSCVTHEHRSAEAPPPPRLPSAQLQARFERFEEITRALQRHERGVGLPPTRELSAGFSLAASGWASGLPFDEALGEEMSGGDFVRNTRQLIDLLRQLGDLGPAAGSGGGTAGSSTGAEVARACRQAADLLRRDVVDAGGAPQ